MTLLPIVERELRAMSRRPTTHWMRCGTALAVLAFGILVYASNHRNNPDSLGKDIFQVTSCVAFALAALSGLFLTADSLSGEKRDGTIGLLFLTDLRGFDVVLGKLAATSCNAVFSLVGALPIIGVTLLIGGVSLGEFIRASAVLLTTMLLSLSVGLLVSAVGRNFREVILLAFILMFSITVGPLILYVIIETSSRGIAPHHSIWLVMLSPLGSMLMVLNEIRSTSIMQFWISILIMLSMSFGLPRAGKLVFAQVMARKTVSTNAPWFSKPTFCPQRFRKSAPLSAPALGGS